MMGLGVYCVYMDLFFFSLGKRCSFYIFFLLDLLKLYSFSMIAEKRLMSLAYYFRCIFYPATCSLKTEMHFFQSRENYFIKIANVSYC